MAKAKIKDLRKEIEELAKSVDVKSHSHNLISLALQKLAREHGTEEANRAVRDFGLEDKGWSQI